MGRAKTATAQPSPVAPAASDEALLALIAAGLRLQSNDTLWRVSGNTLAQSSAVAGERGVDTAPTPYYRDSPVLVKDKVIEGYIRTAQTPPGQRADSIYFERIATAILGALHAGANVVLTTGGTGLSPNDVTPEATRRVIDREVPGIAEALRAKSLEKTAHGMLSRGVAGAVGSALVVNLPGSPRAVRESLEVLLPVLPHAVELLAGQSGEQGHATGRR